MLQTDTFGEDDGGGGNDDVAAAAPTDDKKYVMSDDEGKNVDDDKEDDEEEDETDEFKAWCTLHGLMKLYESAEEYGMESMSEVLEADVQDLLDVCSDLSFSADESNKFIKLVLAKKDKKDCALYQWCTKHQLGKFYDVFLEHNYFSVEQLGDLSRAERVALCKALKIKFGFKKRFENGLPQQTAVVTNRALKQVETDARHNDNDMNMNRTLLFVGETGAGKTTTINSMMNYLFDATFEGDRYTLIQEKKLKQKKKSSQSQTEEIGVYYLNPTAVDFTVTIVDTPGFGNCDDKGIQFDSIIGEKLEEKFKTTVTEVDAICFVVKSNQNRLTQRQEYVFRKVVDVFAEDVKDNIFLLFTYDDGTDPPQVKSWLSSPSSSADDMIVSMRVVCI